MLTVLYCKTSLFTAAFWIMYSPSKPGGKRQSDEAEVKRDERKIPKKISFVYCWNYFTSPETIHSRYLLTKSKCVFNVSWNKFNTWKHDQRNISPMIFHEWTISSNAHLSEGDSDATAAWRDHQLPLFLRKTISSKRSFDRFPFMFKLICRGIYSLVTKSNSFVASTNAGF